MPADVFDQAPDAVIEIEKAFGVTFGTHENLNVFCPFHEDPDESITRSCSVSRTGLFKCHSCGQGGTAREFHDATLARNAGGSISTTHLSDRRKDRTKGTRSSSTRDNPTTIRPSNPVARVLHNKISGITEALVTRAERYLRSDAPRFHRYLHTTRGLSDVTLRRFQIGADEYRITIPVRDEDGNLLNVRRYLPSGSHGSHGAKMVSHAKGNGSPFLYPYEALPNEPSSTQLILCEGEWDALLLIDRGFNAVTNTGNCSTWSDDWSRTLALFDVIIIFDVNDRNPVNPELDDLGQRSAQERLYQLLDAGCQKVKRVVLSLSQRGGDITDWFMTEKHTATELQALIDTTPWALSERQTVDLTQTPTGEIIDEPSIPKNLMSVKPDPNAPVVTLADAADPKYFHKCIRLRCLVAGHGVAPYIVPKRVHMRARDEGGATRKYDRQFTAWDGVILSLLLVTQATQKRILRGLAGISRDAYVDLQVLETMTVEEVFLIPAIDTREDQGPYVLRRCFYVGHGLKTNQVYDFLGYTIPDPKTQAVTHVLVQANAAETNLDNFTLTSDRQKELAGIFQPGEQTCHAKLEHIANELCDHITHIYGRADLHIALDLVFHSPLAFDFEGTHVHRGWLECAIIGDTRTGKGYVANGMVEHYAVGEIISGENLTLAGLVGAVHHIGDRWNLVWGKLPLNDRRLVVLDECGGLSTNDISRLSRIRSEGIAEITKVVSEKTNARTRLIWLGNPRPGVDGGIRMVRDFNYGIEAATGLIGAAEDIARFDYILIVAQNEVSTDTINKVHKPDYNLTYTTELCRDIVLWAWSRKPHQIVFEKGVVNLALKAARALGRDFSARICLIQPEDVRFKLARIAAATAARLFSTDDGEYLQVRTEHMQFAYNFLHHIYAKPSSGYAQLSTADRRNSELRDPAGVRMVLDAAASPLDLVEGLLEHRNITARDMCDYAGIDQYQARTLIGELVRHRAITKEYSYYVKKPAFKKFLQSIRADLASDDPVTQGEDISN